MVTRSTKSTHTAKTDRYLCFVLGAEEYAIPILGVFEVQTYTPPTPMPRMPPHIRGVVNLRGEIVPIVDLRLRLGLPTAPNGANTVFLFLTVNKRLLGVVVDAATKVMDIAQDRVGAAPQIGREVDTTFIAGLVQTERGMLVLLDTEKLFGMDGEAADEAPASTARAGRQT
jgi:purine-binding chemotaxis protein CheW